MSVVDELVGVQEAARRLGVSTWQVQHLGRTGDLTFVGRGLVDRTSLERLTAARRGSHSRGWAEHTAWGAISLLAGQDAEWLGAVQRSRLRSILRASDVSGVIVRARHRAVARVYGGHSSVATRLRAALIVPDRQGLGLVRIGVQDQIDGYLSAGDEEVQLIRRYALREDQRGQYTLRATTFDLDVVRALAESSDGGRVLAAFDAAGSFDPRERGAAETLIALALDDLKAAR